MSHSIEYVAHNYIKHDAEQFRAQLEENLPGLSDLLVKHQVIIAGSSVLNAISPLSEFSGYDIWVSEKSSKDFIKDFSNLSNQLELDNMLDKQKDCEKFKLIARFQHTNGDKKKFDIMLCYDVASPFFKIMSFDIDACQCLYDGKNIYSKLDTGTLKDKIMSIHNILVDDIRVILNEKQKLNGNNIFSRVLKYHSRGFRLKVDDSLEQGQKLIDQMLSV